MRSILHKMSLVLRRDVKIRWLGHHVHTHLRLAQKEVYMCMYVCVFGAFVGKKKKKKKREVKLNFVGRNTTPQLSVMLAVEFSSKKKEKKKH